MANPDPAATSTSPYVPRPESIAFLYSLPLPPGVTSQPQPRTQQDWALVEQYRLLCQSLTVLGDYERARRKEGLQPVDWKDLNIPHPAQSQVTAPPPRSSLPPPPPSPASSQLDDLSSHNAVAQLSQSLSSFPSSSFTFTSTGSLSDPDSAGQFSLDLSLPLDLDSTTGPASLPSLMSAISELEHCVARLSLEANEARNLQRSLRSEMAVRQKSGQPQQKQLQNGSAKGMSGGGGSAKKNGKKAAKYRSSQESHAHGHETNSNAAGPCQDCGEDHPQIEGYEGGGNEYDHESYQLDLELQHQQLQRQANEVVAAANAANNNGGSGSGLGVKSWEDRELMKALESVSLLDKRADEYRERLKILKEQIQHHAALADALASSQGSGRSAAKHGRIEGMNGNPRFGDVPSDTGMRMVNVNPRSKNR